MGEIILDSEDIRYILQNAGKIKKEGRCIKCDGTGWVNWNCETGDDLKAGKDLSKQNNRDSDECETCDGVGFIR